MDIKKFDIYFCDIKSSFGSVQNGRRPVVIIQNDKGNQNSDTFIIVPLTTVVKKTNQKTHVLVKKNFGLMEDSLFLGEQIMTVSREQLLEYIGHIDDSKLKKKFNDAVAVSLGLRSSGFYNGRYALVKTLCPECLEYYKKKKQYSIIRVDNFQKKKQCDFHNEESVLGYDYFLVPIFTGGSNNEKSKGKKNCSDIQLQQ